MPKKGCLGCSFPLIVGVLVVFLVLFIIGFLSGPIGKGLIGDVGLPSWLSVPRPSPSLPAEDVFHIGPYPITNTVISAWLSIIILVAISYAVTRRLKLIPSRLQAAMESVLGWLLGFCQEVAGEKNGRAFFPVVATIFLFVITNAWLSLVPGFGSISITNPEGEHVHLLRGANTDINLPLAIALVSFISIAFFGMRTHGGWRYLSKFIAVGRFFGGLGQLFRGHLRAGISGLFMGLIDIFVGMLEALSEFIRILSFTFRLFGNMTAGEILILMMMFLVPWVAALPFYGLELLVGFVQALIFGGLTLVFLTVAVAHHGAEET